MPEVGKERLAKYRTNYYIRIKKTRFQLLAIKKDGNIVTRNNIVSKYGPQNSNFF